VTLLGAHVAFPFNGSARRNAFKKGAAVKQAVKTPPLV